MFCCLTKNFHRCFLYFLGAGVSIIGLGLLVLSIGTLHKSSWLTDVLLLDNSPGRYLMSNWNLFKMFIVIIASMALIFGLMTHFMMRLENMVCSCCFSVFSLLLLLMTVIVALPVVNLLQVSPFHIDKFCSSEKGYYPGVPIVLQTEFMKKAHALAKEYDVKMKEGLSKICTGACDCVKVNFDKWGDNKETLIAERSFAGTIKNLNECNGANGTGGVSLNYKHAFEALEDKLGCQGICEPALFWYTKDVPTGQPPQCS